MLSLLRLERKRKHSSNPFRILIFFFLSYSFGIETIKTFIQSRSSLKKSAVDSCYKLRQLFYYKVRHGLLQIATGITKCDGFITNRDRYYKVRRLLQIATVQRHSIKMSCAVLTFESGHDTVSFGTCNERKYAFVGCVFGSPR